MTLRTYERSRRRTKPTMLLVGSVSTGTLRTEDLLPVFVDTADGLRLTRDERARLEAIRRRMDGYDVSGWDSEEADFDLDEVTAILECHTPDYCQFGAHEGDGADFGCWVDWGAIDGARTLHGEIANSREEWNGERHALEVNDHGNATLYRRAGNRWVEVWSVV